ncbi:FAD-dependent oxidoreductase [Candidatus Microgenomates bacterium]|nr:FAD-dependent oxidoreductase [Candidatus Microgenomates bacterium]
MGFFQTAYSVAILTMKVVIVGGGFGGVRVALKLAGDESFQVKLISDRSYFEYHAALYRSATGRSPLEVAIPLADFFERAQNVEVLKDSIDKLDAKKQIATGQSGAKYSYDVLILALGSVTQYFGIKGLKEYSFGVKSIHEALALKRHLHEDLTKQEREPANYVVVGAGATGVELAAELTSYLKKVRRRHKVKQAFKIDLVEAAEHVLPMLPVDMAAKVEGRLEQLGIKLFLSTSVKAETLAAIKLPRGQIHSHTVVWTAGVTNHPFFKKYPGLFRLGHGDRVVVNDYLEAADNIYVIGDSAETPHSGMAQTALRDANFVAGNLKRSLRRQPRRPYRSQPPIYAIPVGPHWSAVLWGSLRIYGRLGWVMRRLADLRLYLKFLPPRKALTTWRYGTKLEEICTICK